MRKAILAIAFSFCFSSFLLAQQTIGFILKDDRPKVSIPFTLINNLIIVPVTINNQVTLKFIMDTGANSPILTERLFADLMRIQFDRRILMSGPGIIDSIQTYVANSVDFSLPEGIHGKHLSMLVLEEDYIELKKNLGDDIFGIIGYDLFNRFVIKIDYDNLKLTFYDSKKFRAPRSYKRYPLELDNTKPYINTIVTHNDELDTMRLMIDTGASHALLLDIDESKILTMPDSTLATTLGHGLGGEIPGRIGRLSSFQVGRYTFQDILVSIPDPGIYSTTIKRGSRHGTVGGAILKRLNPIFDYTNGYVYFKKGQFFKSPFKYDMSGLHVSYLEDPKRLEITGITSKSPAEAIGLKVGDKIKDINGKNIKNNSLSEIYTVLKSKENKKIKIIVQRENEELHFTFRLRKMI
jgi:hypothetical protein